jgi:hypothetical protein
MLAGEHPFLKVNGNEATNQLALRKNINMYFAEAACNTIAVPQEIGISTSCLDLLSMLLQPDPEKRACFDDFFHSPFLLPLKPEADVEENLKSSKVSATLDIESQGDDDFVFVQSEETHSVENNTCSSSAEPAAAVTYGEKETGARPCASERVAQNQSERSRECDEAGKYEGDYSKSLLLIDDTDICWSSQLGSASNLNLQATAVAVAVPSTSQAHSGVLSHASAGLGKSQRDDAQQLFQSSKADADIQTRLAPSHDNESKIAFRQCVHTYILNSALL